MKRGLLSNEEIIRILCASEVFSVEHSFGRIARFGGYIFRHVGIRRCRFETALTNLNLTYNLDRYAIAQLPGLGLLQEWSVRPEIGANGPPET